jgi:periplasmic divalent cation tolerance protein
LNQAEHIVVLVTVPSRADVTDIAGALLDERLAASVNIVPAIHSLYQWHGERCHTDEVLLLIKTRAALFDRLVPVVRSRHPYEVPGIIALPVVAGFQDYLDWIDQVIDPSLGLDLSES